MAGQFVWAFTLLRKKNLEFQGFIFKGSMLLLSMFVRPKMGYVRGKIGLTGQFDRRRPRKLFAALSGNLTLGLLPVTCLFLSF